MAETTEIVVQVRDKRATITSGPQIVSGNVSYTVSFDLDEEWDGYALKTARFAWTDALTGQPYHIDELIQSDPIPLPLIHDAYEIAIGVYAGNLLTSTAARIPCERSITDGQAHHDDPSITIYEQLLEAIEQIEPQPQPSPIWLVPGTADAAYAWKAGINVGITVPVGDGEGEAHYEY